MSETTRNAALTAARNLFILKGKDGVRMQEIADAANINKGLLHYYFKRKDALFKEVFAPEFGKLFGQMNTVLLKADPLSVKLSAIIDYYFNLLSNDAGLARFVIGELSKNQGLIQELVGEAELQHTAGLLDDTFRENGVTSSPTFAFQVLMNIISLCVFPFMMKDVVKEMKGMNEDSYNSLMEERRHFLKHLIIGSLI